MTAIILYDNFSLARGANILLQRASANVRGFLKCNVFAWRTRHLKSQPDAAKALAEAAEADLIICAWAQSQPLCHWMEQWLEQWIDCRKGKETAIAVLGQYEGPGPGAANELSRFAEKHGIPMMATHEADLPAGTMPRSRDEGHWSGWPALEMPKFEGGESPADAAQLGQT